MDPSTPSHTEFKLSDPRVYLNRQLSWLKFNERVLAQAEDPRHPLLERVRFVSISETNLDEFFMIRVSGLQRQVAAHSSRVESDEMLPEDQLARIQEHTVWFLAEQRRILDQILLPALREEGVHVAPFAALKPRDIRDLRQRFAQDILPILTPLAIDPTHPFPHISNLSLNLLVVIQDKERGELMARVKIPTNVPRFMRLPGEGSSNRDSVRLVRLEEVMAANLDLLFRGATIVDNYVFQVTRDADIVIQETEADDLLEALEDELDRREFGDTVRLVVGLDMPERWREWLVRHLGVPQGALYEVSEPLGLGALSELTRLDRPQLVYPPLTHRMPAELQDKSPILSALDSSDILLYHPYDSFSPVVDFVRSASVDDRTLAIKQTLYRVGPRSPVVEALLQARDNDVEVAATVELKARFDEEPNIEWARRLESAGVHVAYGMLGLKTHAKVCLVVRQEEGGIRRYAHLGTGNYNPGTARVYTDFSFFTGDPKLCEDVANLFNYLTGHSAYDRYRKLLVAPVDFRPRILRLIKRECTRARSGEKAELNFKMNGLNDPLIIRELYRASRSGVKVNLIVRGICCLRPGLPGLSENIRVISIVGRFLEHARVYAFGTQDRARVYLGSGDLMQRNLDGRVEALFPIETERHRMRVLKILDLQLSDNLNAWELKPDGTYERIRATDGDAKVDSQAILLAEAGEVRPSKADKKAKRSRSQDIVSLPVPVEESGT